MESHLRQAAIDYLYGRINYERTAVVPYGREAFRLERMRELLARLENPQDRLRIVHVAGTKGKGSTSAMLAAMLTAGGYRAGLFTSPHLQRLEERFMVDGQPCSERQLIECVEQVRQVAAEMDRLGSEHQPTFFELLTAVGLLHFANTGVDFAVLEVGLGGRLDSTNVCQPELTVITSISFDHTRQLGHTLPEITREKAGIIKPGVALVSGVVQPEARSVVEEVCRGQGSPLVQLGRDFDFDYFPPPGLDQAQREAVADVRLRRPAGWHELKGLRFGLPGRHQAANAAVAVAVADQLAHQGWKLGEPAIRGGLAAVRWPARVEIVGRRPAVVLDSAHNRASAEALLDTLAESLRPRRRILVFATTQEKDISGMLAALLPQFDQVIFTRYLNNPRGVSPEELLPFVPPDLRAEIAADPLAAWNLARASAGPEDLICVTGSMFIAAELRPHLLSAAPAGMTSP